jgi:hypothetical protein
MAPAKNAAHSTASTGGDCLMFNSCQIGRLGNKTFGTIAFASSKNSGIFFL